MKEQSKNNETKASPEAQNEYHQHTVRIALYRLNNGLYPPDQMIPKRALMDELLEQTQLSGRDLEQALCNEHTTVMPEATTLTLEIKANKKDVVNPEQLILPGGGGRKVDPEKPITSKAILKTARIQLFSEVHLNAHKPRIAHSAAYEYSFEHPHIPSTGQKGTLRNTTDVVIATGAPHDHVHYLDLRDKLQNVIGISPSQVTELFANNALTIEGKPYPIVDSLSSNPLDREKAHVKIYKDPLQFKQTVESESYIFEARMQRQILERLVRLAKIGTCVLSYEISKFVDSREPTSKSEATKDLGKIREYIVKIESRLSGNVPIPESFIPKKTVQALLQRGVRKATLAKRSHLATLMSQAVIQVGLDTSTEHYKEAGPQFPLLLSHMLSQISVWGAYEYVIISKCPELKHIVDTACAVFDIDPKNDQWHEQLVQQFADYRQLEFTNNPAYKHTAIRIAKRFCNPKDTRVWSIKDYKKLGILSGDANKLIEREIVALSKRISKTKLNPLNGDPLGNSASELTELMMVMMGTDQYEGETVKSSERAAAMCKMVHELHMDRVDTAAKAKANLHIKPFRASFKSIIGKHIETLTIDDERYTKHRIPSKKLQLSEERKEQSYDGMLLSPIFEGIDLRQYDIDIFFAVREKERFSRYRKFLSQGELAHPEHEMTDEFGFMFALDMDKWKKEFVQQYPDLPKEKVDTASEYFSVWAIQRILLNFHDSIMSKRDALHPSQRLKKGRFDDSLEHVLRIDPQEAGSPGSESESFGWIKYSCIMEDTSGVYEMEWQIFKTLEHLLQKKRDDPEYDIKRRFQFINNRYSMMAVLFGSQEAYEEAMREYHEKKNTDSKSANVSATNYLLRSTFPKRKKFRRSRSRFDRNT